jgi:Protein of unknown function (DUF2795)
MSIKEIWLYRAPAAGLDLTGFDVEAIDGSIGEVDEASAEAGENYLVVDTGPWIFGKKVFLPAGVVERVDAVRQKVFVNRSRNEIRNAPEYDEDSSDGSYRQLVGSYYAQAGGQARGERRSAPIRRASRGRTTGRKASQSKGRRSRQSRGRTSDEPTRDELYEQAKRLDITGRSKMNKAQLKRAVGRRQGRATPQAKSGRTAPRRSRSQSRRGKANPVEVQAFLEGVSYPTRKGDLVREAERRGASSKVRSTLERLPDERFEDPTQVSEAVGNIR